MDNLAGQACGPCNKLTPRLKAEEIEELSAQLIGWEVREGKLFKRFEFGNFPLEFVHQAGMIAETENHHPEIRFGWQFAEFTIWTHAINGLSNNDFILAAKIDARHNRSTKR